MKFIKWLLNWLSYLFARPHPITNLYYEVNGVDMKIAVVNVKWTKSVSTDVQTQVLTYKVGTNDPVVELLLPDVEQFGPLEWPENTDVQVAVVVNDGKWNSEPVELTFNTGDLTPPESVSGLSVEIVEVKEVE